MSTIIAFCGVDGSGKSTIIDHLESIQFFQNASYIRKNNSVNVDMVKQYHNRNYGGNGDWIKGSFAEAVSYASALDFLSHYHNNIVPKLNSDYIVCDRYFQGFEAYYYAVGGRMKIADLFKNVVKPDVIVFIDAPLDVLDERYSKRGGPSEDESVDVMRVFREAYLELFKKIKIPVIIINNDRDLDNVFLIVEKELKDI